MYRKNLVTIDDLSDDEIEDVLELAGEMSPDLRAFPDLAAGQIMASLFFEPSTRTRGSFESAMNRLGGRVITTVGAGSSSMEKGETLVDTIRVWSGYSDILVLRHPWEGAARLAADYASVPVVNAGDGGHEHPTQTLCDLFTLAAERGGLRGLKVAICGDLKHGRTVHSLISGLLRFGAELFFVPGEGLGLPEHVKTKIEDRYGKGVEKVQAGDFQALYGGGEDGGEGSSTLDAIYMTPSHPHQQALFDDSAKYRVGLAPGQELVFYVTRRQVEREPDAEGAARDRRYPRISKATMKSRFSGAIVLHPLPRVDEVSFDMDEDHRSKYFVQAGYGVPVRMALLSLLLGLKPWNRAAAAGPSAETATVRAQGLECANPACVVNWEPPACQPVFRALQGSGRFRGRRLAFACRYCDWQLTPRCYGMRQSGKLIYKPIGNLSFISQHQLHQFRFFADEAQAEAAGYEPSASLRVAGAVAREVTA